MKNGNRIISNIIVFVIAFSVADFSLQAATTATKTAATSPTTAKKTASVQHRSAHHPSTRKAGSKSTKAHRQTAKGRRISGRAARRRYMAKLHPEASRINQIQEKLAEAGYLHQAPTGRWDEETRTAMREYQLANGFPATGLPEAKSLMKLGLGPHPLPPDVNPHFSLDAKATPDSSSPADPPARAPRASDPKQPGSPPSEPQR